MSKKKNNNIGKVYRGQTKYIDKETKKERYYVVLKDNGKNISVAKLKSIKKIEENPVPMKVFNLPDYTQCIEPYYFGVPVSKKTYLWIKGLPLLCPTNVVESIYSFQTYPLFKNSFGKSRQKNRSKTFVGVANAMALSWG